MVRKMYEDQELQSIILGVLTYRRSQGQRSRSTPQAINEQIASEAEERLDYRAAIAAWRSLADQGDVKAQLRLGSIYSNGLGVAADSSEALHRHRMAAARGAAEAQATLGHAYETGRGVPRDYMEAAHWFRMAAEQGNTVAQVELAFMYDDGHGVHQDYADSTHWFRMQQNKVIPVHKTCSGMRMFWAGGCPGISPNHMYGSALPLPAGIRALAKAESKSNN